MPIASLSEHGMEPPDPESAKERICFLLLRHTHKQAQAQARMLYYCTVVPAAAAAHALCDSSLSSTLPPPEQDSAAAVPSLLLLLLLPATAAAAVAATVQASREHARDESEQVSLSLSH